MLAILIILILLSYFSTPLTLSAYFDFSIFAFRWIFANISFFFVHHKRKGDLAFPGNISSSKEHLYTWLNSFVGMNEQMICKPLFVKSAFVKFLAKLRQQSPKFLLLLCRFYNAAVKQKVLIYKDLLIMDRKRLANKIPVGITSHRH